MDLLIILRFALKFGEKMPKGAPHRVQMEFENSRARSLASLMGLIADEVMKCENEINVSEYVQELQNDFISTLNFNYKKYSGYKILCMILKSSNKHHNFHQILRHSADMALQVIGKVNKPHSEIYMACLLRHSKSVAWDQYSDEVLDFIDSEKLGISTKKIM